MAQYWTDLSEHPTGSQPSEWVDVWHGAGWEVTSNAPMPGGVDLRVTSGATGTPYGVRWTVPGSPGDTEIVGLLQCPDSSFDLWLMARGHGTKNGYFAGFEGFGRLRHIKYVSGSQTVLGTNSGITMSAGERWWVRLQVSGTTIRTRAWEDGTSEPGTWHLSTTDSSHSSGYTGLMTLLGSSSGNMRAGLVGVGTGGDAAPTDPPPQTVTPSATIGSGAAVGTPSLSPGPVTVTPQSTIPSGADVGEPTLDQSGIVIGPETIESEASVGTPTLSSGPTEISVPSTIASTSAVGAPQLHHLAGLGHPLFRGDIRGGYPGFGVLGGLAFGLFRQAPASLSKLLAAGFEAPPRPRELLLLARPFDADADGEALVTLSAGGFRYGDDGSGDAWGVPAWTPFWGDLIQPGSIELNLVNNGRWNPDAERTFGEIRIGNLSRRHDHLRRLRWELRPLEILWGPLGYERSLTPFRRVFSALVRRQPGGDREEVTLSITDRRASLDRPINDDRLLGLGDAYRFAGGASGATGAVPSVSEWEIEGGVRWISGSGTLWIWGANDTTYQGRLYVTAGGELAVEVRRGTGAGVTVVGESIDDAKRHDFRVVVTGAEVELWMDGAVVGTAAPPSYTNQAAAEIRFGEGFAASGPEVELDNWRLWDPPRSDDAYQLTRNQRLTAATDTYASWRFGDGTGTTAFDSGPEGFDVTLTGGRWVSTLTGPPALRGSRRRRGWGRRRMRTGHLVDPRRGVYEVLAHAADEITPLRNGAQDLTFLGDFADPYEVDPAHGEYLTVLSQGLVRIGGSIPQASKVAFDWLAGTANPGRILQDLAVQGGIASEDIDQVAIGELILELDRDIGVATGDKAMSWAEAMSLVTETLHAAWYLDLLRGKLTVLRRGAPQSPEVTITETMTRGSPEIVDMAPPAKGLVLRFREHEEHYEIDDVDGSLDDDERLDLTEPWRLVEQPEDATIRDLYLSAKTLEIDTLYDKEDDARAALAERWELESTPPRGYSVPLAESELRLRVGQWVELKYPMEDLDAGRTFQVWGLTWDLGEDLYSAILVGDD